MAFYELLNPILNPLLNLGAFTTILVISIIVSLLTTLIYKYTTDQKRLKYLKDETKSYQNKLKNLKSKPEEAMKVQQEMMKVNMEYMKASFKPMFFTIIPVLLFFGWLGANLAFVPLMPDTPFDMNLTLVENVNAQIELLVPDEMIVGDELVKQSENNLVSWKSIKGPVGIHELKIKNLNTTEEQFFTITISDIQTDSSPVIEFNSPTFKKINTNQEKVLIFENIPVLGSIPWIKTFGWLGAYISFSLIFSTLLRKWMKIS